MAIITLAASGMWTDINLPRIGFTDDQIQKMQKLVEARSRWDSLGLENYDYVTRWQCFCPPEVTTSVELSVHDGDITAGEFVPNSGLTADVDLSRYETIDEFFDLIADAIERNAHSIQVSYHPEQGYPQSAFIDYDEGIVDEELGFTVAQVQGRQ